MTSRSTNSNSNFVVAKSYQSDRMCPVTPPSPSKRYQMSPSKSSKHETELKTLTTMVQALAQKLKKRDKQMRQLQEKANKLNEVALELEGAEERLVDAAAENQTLSRRVRTMEGTMNSQDAEENDRLNNAAKGSTSPTKHVDKAEFRQVRSQRDSAMEKAGAMSVALAESRAESDELRDQLASITLLLQHQTCGSSLAPESPVIVRGQSLRNLSNLFKSPKAPGRPPLL
jgi:predicted RNase H-like nuclease (RuvC/YqgF family)